MGEVVNRGSELKKIEEMGSILESHLILDNRYTEHSTVGLAQQWDQLNQLGMRIRHNLEQQIQARNQSGVSEDALKEFSMMFRHFDKDKTGRLDLNAFKSCLRALGYDLPMVEEGEPEPEFEQILVVVDPNKDGFVTLQDYMAFMISKETENVQSSEEIENAFRAITAQEREYVTQEELQQPEQRDGGLLHRQDETLCGPSHRPGHHWSPRLHGVHKNTLLLVQWHLLKKTYIYSVTLYNDCCPIFLFSLTFSCDGCT